MKNLMQLKSLIKNLSKEKKLNPQIVLRITFRLVSANIFV